MHEVTIHTLVSEDDLKVLMSVAQVAPPGIFIEVGVFQGGSAYFLAEIAQHQHRQLWLFDTFEGMPEATEGVDDHKVGDFSDCSVDAVRALIPSAFIFKGVFPNTLMPVLPPVAFAHIDCDQYESVRQCIMRLGPFMARGGIMYFDDYLMLEGATRAVDELVPGRIVLSNGKAMVIFP